MVPDKPAPTSSAAESFIFDRIRDDLPGEWAALHSVGLTIHGSKPWAEIDFVLIGPPGVYCLEVKGGLVTREEGVWYTTPQHGANQGKRSKLKESPFAQVASAAAELFHFLENAIPKARETITGYAVVAPDLSWTARGPDIDLALVYDESDTLRSFEDFMDRVTKRWTTKVGSNWNRKLKVLGRADKQLILESIRGDFQLVPALRATADVAERDLIRLTEEQCTLFGRLASNPRVVATGGAGTGKTVIAVEEARRLASSGQRVLYTCFNRNLASHVAALLASDALITVRTLHGLMMEVVDRAGRRYELPDVSEDDLMSLFLPELALEILLDDAGAFSFDAVVIDEGQDLLREGYLDVIEALIGGDLREGQWRLFIDPNQNIFGGVAPAALKRLRDAQPVEWPLTVNCRNTAPIAAQVAILSGVPLSETLAPEGPDVAIQWFDSLDEERIAVEATVRKLEREGFTSERIAILSRRRLESSAVARSSIAVTDVSRGGSAVQVDGIRFSTVSSFKGLEADIVLLVDVDDLSTNEGLASVYVGTSRAKVGLYVFLASSERDRFRELAKEFGRRLAETTA